MLEDHREELQAFQTSTLLQAVEAGVYRGKTDYVFGTTFLLRIYEKLDEDLKAKVQEWEAILSRQNASTAREVSGNNSSQKT